MFPQEVVLLHTALGTKASLPDETAMDTIPLRTARQESELQDLHEQLRPHGGIAKVLQFAKARSA